VRILLNLQNAEASGGSELSLLELAQGLSARGHRLDLAYQRPGRLLQRLQGACESATRVPEMHMPGGRLRELGPVARSAARAARRLPRPDLVYVNGFGEVAYGAILAALCRAPMLCHLRNHRPRGHLNCLALARAAACVAVSQFVRDAYVTARIEPELVRVAPIGVALDRYRPVLPEVRAAVRTQWGVPDGSPAVLYAGRLVAGKGLETLFDAFLILREALPEARLVIAPCRPRPGRGERDFARRLRQRRGPWTFVSPTEDVVPYYGAADVVAVPSTGSEALSRVPIEAMACERPVVATRVGGLPEIFDGSLEELLVEPGDARGLATKLEWAVRWRSHSPRLGERCRERVGAEFGLERMLDGVETAILSAIHVHSQRRLQTRRQRRRDWWSRSQGLMRGLPH
jgi:glycosyltransferase involved in cell wall biosynthesis